MTRATLSQAYRAAVEARPATVDSRRMGRVLDGIGDRGQRDEDLSVALEDPAFVAALRIATALRSDAEALSTDLGALRTPTRRQAVRRVLPLGWAAAASVALAAFVGLALQPMQSQPPMAPLAQQPVMAEADLISSVSFEQADRNPQAGAVEGSIFVDRFDS